MEFSNKLPSATEYTITGGSWNAEYQVVLDGTTLYHVTNTSSTPDKPYLTFYAGDSADSPIVGSGKYISFSSNIQIILGDPDLPKTVTSAKLSKKGFMATRHVFQMEVDRQMRTFAWKNTELNDNFGPLGSHKLVNEANEVIASFLPGGARLKPDGALLLYADFGDSFVLMALITALVLREKTRRSVNGGYGNNLRFQDAGATGFT
ncbi:uncharacterized protein N7529_001796 [Penicillium soppii]|jgi:hypothetical protein|uniref:uncharacterized protein n=1 Tax=Penicillium soppii TaxID=69789 RepID=UPI0025496925|nr:uncharacterized protein N7529_001796 [Penicillium soppii]KAJ5876212.1 hypothetical protein N7529_001796 [Penicillium soppii]